MTFKECEQTWICQLNKPYNVKILKKFAEDHNKSGESLASYYEFIVNALKGTPAFGVSGVNKFLNELTDTVRTTIKLKGKVGKTSSYAHAKKVLNAIKFFKDKKVIPYYNGRYKLQDLLTDEELDELRKIK